MKDLQELIARFLKQRGWNEHSNPSSYAKSISIEAAELLEHFQWKEPSVEAIRKDPELFKAIQSELADVLIYGLDMASVFGLDAAALVRSKMRHNARKYPIRRVRGSEAAYYRIKKEFRKKAKISRSK